MLVCAFTSIWNGLFIAGIIWGGTSRNMLFSMPIFTTSGAFFPFSALNAAARGGSGESLSPGYAEAVIERPAATMVKKPSHRHDWALTDKFRFADIRTITFYEGAIPCGFTYCN